MTTITRTPLGNGKYRYEVDGAIYMRLSTKLYTHASLYRDQDGEACVFLHSRRDLAEKGNLDANRWTHDYGWTRVPGVTPITEGGL